MDGNLLLGLWPWVLLLGFMYLLLIRPQQKREKERKEMLSRLKVGDAVVTIGGIHGSIRALRDEQVHLEIADDITIIVSKMAIAGSQQEAESEIEEAS